VINKFTKLALAAAMALTGAMAHADGHTNQTWTLDGESSKVAFGSIKKDKIGEAHHFTGLDGTVAADGTTTINIDLTSIETWIDVRNGRMLEHVFKGITTATLTAGIDMEEVAALGVGESSVIDVEGNLALVGTDIEIEVSMFVMRVADDQVLVTTDEMLFLGTEDAGIDAGVSKLMELAKLPGITRTSPVTLRFVFNADIKKAEVAPAASALQLAAIDVTGDTKKGKKVFKKCKACHKLDDGKNGTGPHLFKIMGRQAATVEGFKYSDAMAGSGITWGVEEMTAFLAKPKAYIKGTKMSFNGLKKPADIENLIAYMVAEAE
jgi:cytochrome c2/polyisoprenoid-binding protein YceI